MKGLQGVLANGRVIVGEREWHGQVEVCHRDAVIWTGSVRYVRLALRKDPSFPQGACPTAYQLISCRRL
jgi:hypothetical protein